MDDYQRALMQLDELIKHFRSQGEVSCSVAEAEESLLIKLADLKIDLKPEHTQDIANINLFYRRHIRP
ncbi:branched-chain amino acid ABC transporter [Neisseria sp. CCUG12390]|uniref:branched-chain amino acid ABC transporter n=1 Tax=Neisseria sp. CCUG12390 TaxID=3392035 RepID=UPI003A101B54